MAATDSGGSSLKKFAPYIAIVAIIVIGGVVFAMTRSDDDGDSADEPAYDDVKTALTFAEAQEQDIDTSDWKNCDQDTGRIAIPNSYATSCVQPKQDDDEISDGVKGVTDDSITVVVYISDPANDPLLFAAFGGLSLDTNPDDAEATIAAYTELFADHYETYGRTIDLQFYRGTGAGDDHETARADAVAIDTQYDPFAVINGPLQSPAFAQEIASRGIVCLNSCALAPQREVAVDLQPYVYSVGPLPEQGVYHAAEFIGKQLTGKNAEYAGDEAMHDQERVFGYVAYNTEDAYYTPMINELESRLKDEYDTEFAVVREHMLDLEVAAERAETFIASMKDAGVTSILITGDPVMPSYLTSAATAQDYYPEWILGPTVLADSTAFARASGVTGGYDPAQWANAFGISLPGARGEQDVQQSWMLFQWQYCEAPVSNVYSVHIYGPQTLVSGIHLAGPNLTPESFQAGLMKGAPHGGVPTVALNSRGDHGVWPEFDVGGSDDVTLVFWDPEAEGPSETGEVGLGMYRYVDSGKRYAPLEWPTDEITFFDYENSPTLITDFSGEDMLPPYDSPCGGPPAESPSGVDPSRQEN